MITSILFDADGVILTSEYFSSSYSRDFGVSPELLQSFFEGDYLECLTGKKDLKVELETRLTAWKWQGTVDELLEYWFTLGRVVDERLMENISAFRSRGIRCYIATNQEKYRTRYFSEIMGLDTYFDGLFASCDLGFRKPNPEFYTTILTKIGNPHPGNVLYFDDLHENVTAAARLGIQAEFYSGYATFLEQSAKYLSV